MSAVVAAFDAEQLRSWALLLLWWLLLLLKIFRQFFDNASHTSGHAAAGASEKARASTLGTKPDLGPGYLQRPIPQPTPMRSKPETGPDAPSPSGERVSTTGLPVRNRFHRLDVDCKTRGVGGRGRRRGEFRGRRVFLVSQKRLVPPTAPALQSPPGPPATPTSPEPPAPPDKPKGLQLLQQSHESTKES